MFLYELNQPAFVYTSYEVLVVSTKFKSYYLTLTNDADIVRKILRQNPRLASRKDDNGYSALHLASRKGNVEVIKEFLGNDPILSFLRDSDGRTPLHCAVISEQLRAFQEYLFERPGPILFNHLLVIDLINIADNNGDTVLHLAAKMTSLEVRTHCYFLV